MNFIYNICDYLSDITSIDKEVFVSIFVSIFIVLFFSLIKSLSKKLIKKKINNGRGEFIVNQSFQMTLNVIEVMFLFIAWGGFLKNIMTLISVLSAAMTIALREIILNFFCGLYIRIKKPFRIEDRIQIDDIKGDVMNIFALGFEILEVSTKEENGQSTGVIITYPNSVVFSKPIKNINKGFKYIWDEITINIRLDCDLKKNKQEIYKIVNNIETIKSIPRKMQNEIQAISSENRVYFNNYDPIIYTKIVNDHIELNVRYLMHPKKARYVESVIWNKIYMAFREGKINLFLGLDAPEMVFQVDEEENVEEVKETVKEKKKK